MAYRLLCNTSAAFRRATSEVWTTWTTILLPTEKESHHRSVLVCCVLRAQTPRAARKLEVSSSAESIKRRPHKGLDKFVVALAENSSEATIPDPSRFFSSTFVPQDLLVCLRASGPAGQLRKACPWLADEQSDRSSGVERVVRSRQTGAATRSISTKPFWLNFYS